MENNDFDIDKLFDDQNAFKPLTKGLGFHHSLKSEKEVSISLKKSSEMLKNDLEKRAKVLNTNVSVKTENLDRGDLSPFYTEEISPREITQPSLEQVSIKSMNEASLTSRFGAWMIDVFLVSTMYLMTLTLIVFASSLNFKLFLETQIMLSFLKQTAPLFVFYYLFYFSFFDKTEYSTVGKRAFSLKVCDERGAAITMYQAFLRSFLTLVSFASLGLFSVLDFHGKMTETKVNRIK